MTPHPSPPRRTAARPAQALSKLKAQPARWIVPVTVLAGALAGGAYAMASTPQYSATSYVIVVPTEKSDPAAAIGFATAYGRVASQVAVLGDAQVWAGVSARTLRDNVQTATSPDAPMISVTATAPRPATAVNMADGVARSLVVNGTHLQGSTNVRVLQFSRAVKPAAPVSASPQLAALVGGSAGGLLGGLALLMRPRRRLSEPHASVPAPATSAQPQPETV